MNTFSSECTDELKQAWELYITKGVIAENVRPIIARSWERCKRLDPYSMQKPLSQDLLHVRQRRMKDVIEAARPVMREICRVSDRNYIELFDRDGYSLEGFGNAIFPPVIGFNCDEKAIGTNAIGIALIEDVPIEMKGAEHYACWLHSFSCAAAPIHDAQGNIVAVINITNPSGSLPPWVFNLICLGAKLIENILNHKEACDVSTMRQTFGSIIDLMEGGTFEREPNTRGNVRHFTLTNPLDHGLSRYSSREDLVGKNVSKIFLNKPVSITEKTSGYSPRKEPEQLRGKNRCWDEIRKLAESAARYKSNVLIHGESGTGKEVIAKAIHELSGRKGRFVAINCGAIPPELVQSELYGYEEGAFTGAKKGGYIGKFELADQGTIFLDEIGEMPLNMQVNLLRFLQDKTISRIGSAQTKRLDVQIIAATNRNLEHELEIGRFRADLYYRLDVVNIYLPPLRERKDDIPWLVDVLLREIGDQFNCVIGISDRALEALEKYDWPGNVRELRNVLERAFISRGNTMIMLEDLPAVFCRSQDQIAEDIEPLRKTPHSERETIVKALMECRGNVSQTAKTLGISRVTLYKKMRELNIAWQK